VPRFPDHRLSISFANTRSSEELSVNKLFERPEFVFEAFQAPRNIRDTVPEVRDPVADLVRADPHPAQADNYRADVLIRVVNTEVSICLSDIRKYRE